MAALYTTASAIPGIIADPATLAPQSVRCLWMRPVLNKDSMAAFLPSVVFTDGTDCPLACEMNDLHARQFCQRLAAIHDWPVKDGRVLEGSAEVAADRVFASLDEGDRMEMDGKGWVNIPGMGRMAAIFAHEAGLPLGVAVEGITHKLARMFADIEAKGAMPPHDVKKNMRAATEAACAKLAELYGDETQGPGAGSLSPAQFGILVADYHYSKGSTDELFQRGLTAALEAGAEAWRAQGEGEDEMDQKTDLMLDASLRHWFRLTGRAVRSV
ncbi:MAG: hypothetical protein LKH76_10150 [Acetobacter fabarum]|uniref:hypothetical protein n=1 Tax=Acetobacter fabarum TaxID=483199 RepID=UPI00242F2075|nr:hypothetical protein [Acetobacter fabarum]MCH4025235.1 hypothetical protein [Acetobacter fabarum]MCH4055116.1 hypothetical protein [Acetobacter fabarum]MCH4128875.1 hypothetical protein [Acetobacter fabarum]MCH4142064.1 hypothetical protein [Acetobacter fabarum]MCI1393813.1 hypothetical protein [Acetobacter fabarum]